MSTASNEGRVEPDVARTFGAAQASLLTRAETPTTRMISAALLALALVVLALASPTPAIAAQAPDSLNAAHPSVR